MPLLPQLECVLAKFNSIADTWTEIEPRRVYEFTWDPLRLCLSTPLRKARLLIGECAPVPPTVNCNPPIRRPARLRFTLELYWTSGNKLKLQQVYTFTRKELDPSLYVYCGVDVFEEDILQFFARWFGGSYPLGFPLLKDDYDYTVGSCFSAAPISLFGDGCDATEFSTRVEILEQVRYRGEGFNPPPPYPLNAWYPNASSLYTPVFNSPFLSDPEEAFRAATDWLWQDLVFEESGTTLTTGQTAKLQQLISRHESQPGTPGQTIYSQTENYRPSYCTTSIGTIVPDCFFYGRDIRTLVRVCLTQRYWREITVNNVTVCTPFLSTQCRMANIPTIPAAVNEAPPLDGPECRVVTSRARFKVRAASPASAFIFVDETSSPVVECLCGTELTFASAAGQVASLARLRASLGLFSLGYTIEVSIGPPC